MIKEVTVPQVHNKLEVAIDEESRYQASLLVTAEIYNKVLITNRNGELIAWYKTPKNKNLTAVQALKNFLTNN
jgi:hypothetical protein